MMKAYIAMLILCALTAVLAPTAGRSQPLALQSDWSGGRALQQQPVDEWSSEFAGSAQVAWRSVPGQLSLGGVALQQPVRTIIAADAGMPKTVALGDLDGDGQLDIVSSDSVTQLFPEFLGAIFWWHRGADSSWEKRVVDADFYGAEHVDTADVDGDGDLDVIASAYYGEIDPPPPPPETRNGRYAWFENLDGEGGAWQQHIVGELYWGARYISSGDLDGDGDLDLVGASDLTSGVWEQEGDVVWFENVGGEGRAWNAHDLDLDFENAYQAHALDLDLDGDVDVVATATGEIAWWENLGDGSAWQKRSIETGLPNVGHAAMGDIDSDGDLDVFGGSYSSSLVYWWENLGGAMSWQIRVVVGLPHVWSSELADLDGDGDLDAAVSTSDGGAGYWIENVSGDGVLWQIRTLQNLLGSPTWLRVGDVDGNGRLDAVLSTNDPFGEREEQIASYDLTASHANGWLVSSILDGQNIDGTWNTLAWHGELAEGSQLRVSVRAADDPEHLGPWAPVLRSGQGLAELIPPAARYFQYRIAFASRLAASPILSEVGVYALGLTAPVPGRSGELNQWFAAGLEEGSVVSFLASRKKGTSTLLGCNTPLQLENPALLGTAVVDDATAELIRFMPQQLGGKRLYFQAVDRDRCLVSNLVQGVLAPASP